MSNPNATLTHAPACDSPTSTGSPANPLRRYEHACPGSLIHVDVTEFGNIPDSGGRRFGGCAQGDRNKRATPETAATATAVLRRAVAWFADRGVTVERVLSDNGSAYRSHAWRDTCTELGITPKRTRPYRPQTNGKSGRFHRTLTEGWAFARFCPCEQQRRAALPG